MILTDTQNVKSLDVMIETIWTEQICMNKLNIHDLESSLATPLGRCTKQFKQSDTSVLYSEIWT